MNKSLSHNSSLIGLNQTISTGKHIDISENSTNFEYIDASITNFTFKESSCTFNFVHSKIIFDSITFYRNSTLLFNFTGSNVTFINCLFNFLSIENNSLINSLNSTISFYNSSFISITQLYSSIIPAIYVRKSNITAQNVIFDSIFHSNPFFDLYNSTIDIQNSKNQLNGGFKPFYHLNHSKIFLQNSSFISNKSPWIYTSDSSTNIVDSTIDSNCANNALININRSEFNAHNISLINNRCGLMLDSLDSNAQLQLLNGSSNFVPESLFKIDKSSITISESALYDTVAIKDSAFSIKNSKFNLKNAIFNRTHSRHHGSAFSFLSSDASISNCSFLSGMSRSKSAAMFFENSSFLLINTAFTNNSAMSDKSIYSEASNSSIKNCTFSGSETEELSIPLLNNLHDCSFGKSEKVFVVEENISIEKVFVTIFLSLFLFFVIKSKLLRFLHHKTPKQHL